jgi:protein-S-isoprenylcysteine O-methyltransferase Ste14
MSSPTTWVRTAIAIAVIDLALLGAGLHWDTRVPAAWLAWSVGAIAMVTFLGALILVHKARDNEATQTQQMRIAITASFVMVYLVLLGLSAFRLAPIGDNGKPIPQPATTGSLISSFTALMATIVAFYFATTTAEHISANRNADRQKQREHDERMAEH